MSKDNLSAILKDYERYLSIGSDPREYIYYPSSIIALNKAIGDVRGVRSGSVIQLVAEPGRGKSTVAMDFIAQAQKNGLLKDIKLPSGRVINAVYADFERTYDPDYAKLLGIDNDKILLVKTNYAEETFDILLALLEAGLRMIIIDSISMTIPKANEGKSQQENEKVAAEAKAIGRFLKQAIQLVDNADALLILINQFRANLAPMAMTDKKAFGAMMIQYAIRASVTLIRTKREDTRMHIQAFVEKTKLGATGKKIEFDIVHGKGLDSAFHIIELATEFDIVKKKGAWYYYGDIGAQGKNNIHKLPIEEIKLKVMEQLNNAEDTMEDEE